MRYDPVKQRAVFRNEITGRELTVNRVNRVQADRFAAKACRRLTDVDEKVDQTRALPRPS